MRDYNAIQFRSPSDKQKQQQQQVMTSTTTTTTLPYSPGLISTVRSTSLSPIPRVNHHTSHHNNNNNNNNKMMTANVGSPSGGGGNYSGITSTTVMTSSSSIMQSNNNNADDVDDAIRLPYLHNDDDDNNDNKKSRQQQQQQLQQQQSSSMASTNVMTNTTMIKPRMNPVVVASSSSSSSSAASPPQRTSHKSYRTTTSASTDNSMSLSPTPYHTTTNTTGSKQNSAIHPQQQQQQTNATVLSMTNIPPNGVNGSNASVTSNSSTQQQQLQPQPPNLVLSPTDALALRRDYNNNFELYIHKLRTDLEQQQQMIQKISSASSKSDAVILELRSTIRQYKRQLEKLQQSSQSSAEKSVPTTTNTTDAGSSSNNNNKVDTSFQSTTDPIMMLSSDSTTMIQNHPIVLTLTEQLHELQNKLLTADLIRKELEDTIEAEQYTWELRVQDLEREVQELKQQSQHTQQSQSVAVISTTTPKVSTPQKNTTTCRSLDTVPSNNNNDSTNDTNNNNNNVSEEYRKQLEDAQNEIQRYRTIIMTTTTTSDMDDETMMNHNNSSMNTDVSASNNNNNNMLIWKEKVILLEQERMELQGCLDEALKELEAVDLELQQEDTTNTLREENERLQNIIQELQQSSSSSQQKRGLVSLENGTNDVAAVIEQLQHLYRWLLERDGSEESLQLIRKMNQQYETVDELIHVIQEHIDQNCTSISQVQELERQISVHKGDIHAKEEESNEIRNSLKEAVSLLRPIQDSLAKLEKEKGKYQESLEGLQSQQDNNVLEIRKYKQLINDKDDEIDQMKQNIESLEIQLSKAKLVVASTVAAQHNLGNGTTTSRSVMMMDLNNNNNNDVSTSSPSDALDEKRAKRRTGENNLKELLRDAQLRGDTGGGVDALEREQQLRTIQEYEQEISLLRDELAKNDATIQRLQNSLTSANDELLELKQQQQVNSNSGADHQASKLQLQQAELRVQNLEEELQDTKRALASKRDAERSLNKSLKDALGLIKPLQIHLEESEMEKRQMEHELESLMKQQQQHRNNSVSRSLPNGSNEIANAVSIEVVKELETSVRQLEKENAMLHDALEDMSQSLNASHISGASPSSNRILSSKHHPTNNNANNSITNHESTRLHQEFVELQSRYEVTQTRLEDAYHENHTLSELVQQEQDEKYILHDEVATLREQLLLQQRQAGSGTATKSSVSIK